MKFVIQDVSRLIFEISFIQTFFHFFLIPCAVEGGNLFDIIILFHVILLINAMPFYTCFELKVIQDERK